MLKTAPLAVALLLGIAAPAAASPENHKGQAPLREWINFATESATPVAAAGRHADWAEVYRHPRTVPALREWAGFAEETPTPAATTGRLEDWTGIHRRAATPALREWSGFAEEADARKITTKE